MPPNDALRISADLQPCCRSCDRSRAMRATLLDGQNARLAASSYCFPFICS